MSNATSTHDVDCACVTGSIPIGVARRKGRTSSATFKLYWLLRVREQKEHMLSICAIFQ